MKCDYCEEDEDKIIFPKPDHFFFNGTFFNNVQIFSRKDNVCFDCLITELDTLKEVY